MNIKSDLKKCFKCIWLKPVQASVDNSNKKLFSLLRFAVMSIYSEIFSLGAYRQFIPSSGPVANQVEHLDNVQQQRHTGHDQHEDDEDSFLSGARHEALYSVGTRVASTNNFRDHHETVQIVLANYKCRLKQDLKDHAGQVTSQ